MPTTDRPPIRRHEKMIVRYYNKIAGTDVDTFDEIPPDVREFLSSLNYRDIIKPFIAIDLNNDVDTHIICLRYGVKRWIVRTIGQKNGVYAQRRCKSTDPTG